MRDYCGLSYEQVVRRFAPAVHSACLMRLGGHADADDCFQNTFLKLCASAPEFRDENHIKAWLLRVAINECKKYLRDHRRLLPLESAAAVTQPPCEDSRDISWALARLEPKYREALYLYYGERYKVDEIAAILGKKPNTVKSLLKRGRDKLRMIYGGDDDA